MNNQIDSPFKLHSSLRKLRPGSRLARTIAAAVALLAPAAFAQQVIFTDSLDSGDTWNLNVGPGLNRATFGFNYADVGIPPAPNSGGTTIGLKLEANPPGGGILTGVSVSPVGLELNGNYQLRFDLWQNFPGPLDVGGSGSTQVSGGGIGTSGTRAQWVGASYDSIFFLASGDGGTGTDYRVYANANNAASTSGYYAAGTTTSAVNNTDPYYASFGNLAAPAAQLALFPTQTKSTAPGTQGFMWHDVAITKIGNTVTWDIDSKRIATVDLSTVTRALGGSNIELIQSDINGGTTDAAGEPMLFGLFDNVRVIQLPDSTVVTATLMDPDTVVTNIISESDITAPAAFRIGRTTNDLTGALTVNFAITGTATRGPDANSGDYYIRTNGVAIPTANSVVIPASQTNVVLEIVPNDDNVAELDETIILALTPGSYSPAEPKGGTVILTDNEPVTVDISAVAFPQAFEGLTNDFIRYTLTRRGFTNTAFSVNVNYAGSATKDVDYTSIATVEFAANDITRNLEIHPINDSLMESNETVVVSITPGTGYAIGTNSVLTSSATGFIVDDEQPAETVLFSDDFNTDTSANYTILYGANDPTIQNYAASFAYDFSLFNGEAPGLPPFPPAPHSTGGDTLGLYMSVNKNIPSTSGVASGLNLYPTGKTFSGNYALRFDMYLRQSSGSGTTEYAQFGINHDGAHTNWFNNSAAIPAGWTFDGIFASVESDGAALGDYVLNSAPATGSLNGPTTLASQLASAVSTVFHNPPYSSALQGAPANVQFSATPSWAQVELSQIGNLVTLKINNSRIFGTTNNTPFKSGDIMLGYDDAYNSVGNDGGVIYDNVRVVRLADGIHINSITQVSTNLVIDFTGFENEPASFFKLTSSTNVVGPYLDDSTVGTTNLVVNPGVLWRIITPATTNSPSTKFYQVRRVP